MCSSTSSQSVISSGRLHRSSSERAATRDSGFSSNGLSYSQQVRLMRLQEGQSGGQQAPLAGPGAELIRIQSGEVKEPPRAPFVGQRRGERGEGKRFGVSGASFV